MLHSITKDELIKANGGSAVETILARSNNKKMTVKTSIVNSTVRYVVYDKDEKDIFTSLDDAIDCYNGIKE